MSFCVRGSSRPSDGGGAKCSTANGAARRRRSVAKSSRSPTIGTMPCARSFGDVVGAAREPVEAGPAAQQSRGAQRDVTASDQQDPDHVSALHCRAASPIVHAARRTFEMTFEITIKPSEHSFACEDGETVLAAAMRADLMLPYGCRNGACGTCKGKILAGEVDYGPHQASTLTDDEKRAGLRALLLRAAADRPRHRGARGAPRRRHPDQAAAVPHRVDRQGRRRTSRSCASSCRRTSACSTSPASTSTSC